MKRELLKMFDVNIRSILFGALDLYGDGVEEIRLRTNQPLVCVIAGDEIPLNEKGKCKIEQAHIVSKQEIKNTLKFMSNFSLFAIEDQIKKGFFTISGGHRVGVCGKVVSSNGEVVTVKDISSLNIRISRQVVGCSERYLEYFINKNDRVNNTLILSAPNNGKTTFLRDMVRNISNNGFSCVVIDERSELGGTYEGEAQCDLGRRTDILDSCEKVQGMTMALRSMSPKVIVVDEIATDADAQALIKVFNSGVSIIATCHAENIQQLKQKSSFRSFLNEKLFDRYVFMKDKKPIVIYDKDFESLYNNCEVLDD